MVELNPGETVILSQAVHEYNPWRAGVLTLTNLRLIFEVPHHVSVGGVNLLPLIDGARGVPVPMRTMLVVPREEITVHQMGKPLFGNARWLQVGSKGHQGQFVVANLQEWLSALSPGGMADSGSPFLGDLPASAQSPDLIPSVGLDSQPPPTSPPAAAFSAPPSGATCPLCGTGLVRSEDGGLSCPHCAPRT